MCSIIGYLGLDSAASVLVEGLRRMEYRGYDSAGVATLCDGKIRIKKGVGRVSEVNRDVGLDSLSGNVGIGHTRWATHGKVSEYNAHPHFSSSKEIAIVHNGIIENYLELKDELMGLGYTFNSQTDSEIIANLLQRNLERAGEIKDSIVATVSQLKGKYSFVALFRNGTLVAAKYHEPLVVGVGTRGYLLASDILGFVGKTDKVIYLDNREFAVISSTGISLCDFEGRPSKHELTRVSKEFADPEKNYYIHYTLKEICEQSTTILKAGMKSNHEFQLAADIIKRSKNVYLTGSGTSYNAALIGKHLLSKHAKIRVETIVSSEIEFSPIQFDEETVLIALSQSGESADVLETVNIANQYGAKIISIVNVLSSSLARLSNVTLSLDCGPEIGVAATKSFTSQLGVLYKLTNKLCDGSIGSGFSSISNEISKIAKDHKTVKNFATTIKNISDIYVLGRGIHYFIAREASLKLKELPYIHAEALPGGELKHGPLALIDSSTFVFLMNPKDETYSTMLAAGNEIKARGAKIVGISNIPNEIYDYWIPLPSVNEAMFPIIEIVPIQLLAYYSALERNANPDYPRNLAKSVTVK